MIRGAVLGSPISHSLSPLLHLTAYKLLEIEATYEAIEVTSGSLPTFLKDSGLNCLSLTMPLKEEAIPIATEISQIAQQISSGNTLSRLDGGWSLTSTDVDGFKFSLDGLCDLSSSDVLIIGAGATARAAAAAVSGCKKLAVIRRSPHRDAAMLKAASSSTVNFLAWDPIEELNTFDLVINTTPSNAAEVLIPHINNPTGLLFEVLYNPWPTQLLQAWRASSGQALDGLELLVHQAISQIEIFTHLKVDRVEFHQLLRKEALKAIT